MTNFSTALRRYQQLPLVEVDHLRQRNVADLVFGVRIQLDLIAEGEIHATPDERRILERFINQYGN